MSALLIGEAGAEPEPQAVRPLHFQRTEHALVLAVAGQMRSHLRFGVLMWLEFQQIVAAVESLRGVGPAQHQTFAAGGDDFLELCSQRVMVREPELRR